MSMVRIDTSRIAGQGLFATVKIARGRRIVQYVGKRILKDEGTRRAAAGNAYIFELNERYDIDGSALSNTARYINHSCEPNCEVDLTTRTIWIVALKDIQAGEELTYNYGYDVKDYADHPCYCGATTCCGYILDRQYWDLLQAPEAFQEPEPAPTSSAPTPAPSASS